jgi:hypothetical protein
MSRFALAAVVGSRRRFLAFVIAAAAIGGSIYIGTFPLPVARPCLPPQMLVACFHHPSNLYAWHIAIAVLVGVAGVVLAVALASWRNPKRGRPAQPRLT